MSRRLKPGCLKLSLLVSGLVLPIFAPVQAQDRVLDRLGVQLLDLNLGSQIQLSKDYQSKIEAEYTALKSQLTSLGTQKTAEINAITAAAINEDTKASAIRSIESRYAAKRYQILSDMADLLSVLNQGTRVIIPVAPIPAAPAVMPCPPVRSAPGYHFRRLGAGAGAERATGLNQRSIEQFRQAMAGYERLRRETGLNFVASSPAQTRLASEPAFDVRKQFAAGVVYPVQDQGQCGSCWSFAAVAAFEASHAMRFGRDASVSEQSVLSCANERAPAVGTQASCDGAFADAGLAILTKVGALDRGTMSYTAREHPEFCARVSNPSFKASAFGPVNVNSNDPPSVAQIKQHVKEHGAVLVGMAAGQQFRSAQNGVSEDFVVTEDAARPDHAVVIIGWDDSKANGQGAWLVRNSWGPGFGHTGGFGNSGGYIWVQYNKSAIGGEAFWIDANPSGSSVVPSGGSPDILSRIEYWKRLGY